MTTAKDVGRRANVSVSTVGRALADDPRISPETKLRVAKIAAELGYVASHSARMMRGAPSNVIGLIVPDVRNGFFPDVAHALTEVMSAERHQVMLCETGDDRAREYSHVSDLAAARVAGMVIVPTERPHPNAVRLLQTIPHVQLLRRVPSLSPHWFGIDDRAVVATATAHLLELGHRRLAYIGGAPDLSTGAARQAGFTSTVAEAGLPESAGIVKVGPPSSTVRGGATYGKAALEALVDEPDPPTGIVTGSIQITRGVLQAVQELGLQVPRDLSLVGFGDDLGFSWWGPGLTTVSPPAEELAAACGMWLLRRLRSPQIAARPYSSVSAAALTLRASTGRPPTARWTPSRPRR